MTKSWNPVLDFVLKVKKKYIDKFGAELQYKKYGEATCFEYWIEELKDTEAAKMIEPLHITQKDEFILIRYQRYSDSYFSDGDFIENYNRIWNMYDGFYLECRSLVIDLKNECIVLSPFKKFRNLNECPENSLENIKEKIQNAKNIEISEKLDGSMQCARWYNNELFMSGSQAIDPQFSWRLEDGIARIKAKSNYILMLKENPSLTFIFEYIALKDAHIVKYTKEQEGLYLIGIRDIADGRQFSYKEVLEIANRYDILSTKVYDKTFDQILAEIPITKSEEQEGYVLNIDGYLVKVKMDDYVHIHSVLAKFSSINLVIKSIADNQFDDLLSKVPELYKNRILRIANIVFSYIEKTDLIVNSYVLMAPKDSRKSFMIYVDREVPKKFRSYVKNVYIGKANNYLRTENDQPRYKKLKDMGIDDYSAIFEEEETIE